MALAVNGMAKTASNQVATAKLLARACDLPCARLEATAFFMVMSLAGCVVCTQAPEPEQGASAGVFGPEQWKCKACHRGWGWIDEAPLALAGSTGCLDNAVCNLGDLTVLPAWRTA
jgi:hypothetical protein